MIKAYSTSAEIAKYKQPTLTTSRIGFDKAMAPVFSDTRNSQKSVSSVVSKANSISMAADSYIKSNLASAGNFSNSLTSDVNKFLGSDILAGITQQDADLSVTVHRSVDGSSYIVDPVSGHRSTWEWASLSINVPDSIEKPLRAVQGVLDVFKQFISSIKAALEVVKTLTLGLTDIIGAVIDSIVNSLTSLLGLFTVDASIHSLLVPPISPSVPKQSVSARHKVASNIVSSGNELLSDLGYSLPNSSSVIPSINRVGGNKGFYTTVKSKMQDLADTARPDFSKSDYVAGCAIIAGFPLAKLVKFFYSLSQIFAVDYKAEIDYLPKAKTVVRVTPSNKKNTALFIASTSYEKDKYKTNFSSRYVVNGSQDICVVLSPGYSKSSLSSFTGYLVGAKLDASTISSDLVIKNISPDSGISCYIPTTASVASLSNASTKFLKHSGASIPNDSTCEVYLFTTYTYTDTFTNKKDYITVRSSAFKFKSEGLYTLNVNSGNGKYPHWAAAASIFDIIPALGELKLLIDSIGYFLKGFLSDINLYLARIIQQLSDFLNYVSKIVDRINEFLEFLTTLSSLGTGASIVMFQGFGGNDFILKVLEDTLISSTGVTSNSYSSTSGASLGIGAPGDELANTDASVYPYITAGAVRPNFKDSDTVAGAVIVGGSEQFDSAMALYRLLATLLSDSHSSYQTSIAEGINTNAGALDLSGNQYKEAAISLLKEVDTIPKPDQLSEGAYSESLTVAATENDMQEDYCKI